MKGYPTTFPSTTYDFPAPLTETIPEHVNGTVCPIYLSPDCVPLDKYYNYIDGSVFVVAQDSQSIEDIFSRELLPKVFRPQDQPDLEIPNPEDYSTKEEFAEDFAKCPLSLTETLNDY